MSARALSPVRTTCPYCGVGCGVLATATAAQSATIAGDPAHPANSGRLCVKGAALGETLGLAGRLLKPQLRTQTGFQAVTWDVALDRVATGLQRIVAAHGPEAVAFYVSGQLLTEDYYVANKLMKGYFGTANIDTNSRLCMASAVAGHKRAFGEDCVPVSYADLESADLIVLVGANLAWCHPVIHQRILAAREIRGDVRVVVVDPRRTATCADADLHLAIRPGTDVALFNGLLAYLHEHGATDHDFVEAHTNGADEAVAVARHTTGSLAHVARACGVPETLLREFYALFARTRRTVTLFSQGVNQSSAGTDKVNSIINCHLLTGRINRPGMGPLSITGQPNAMGGREVGGMANQLAAHLDLHDAAHRELVQQFWRSPAIAAVPGPNAVAMFDAIHAGTIKAVWVMGTNPVVSLPDADRARTALQRCELVVVSEVVCDTDTSVLAHVRLPALAWGEKSGTVTNSERCISRQRAFLPAPGEARPDWWIVCEVARRLGFGADFAFASAYEIFREHAALSASGQDVLPRQFNLVGLGGLTEQQYAQLNPVRWPVLEAGGGARNDLFAGDRFAHPDGRARLLPVRARGPANAVDDDYPLVLNTGRVRDQWHTMTRTGRAPTLGVHSPEPFVAIHPHDALAWGVQHGRLARVASRYGACVLRVAVTADQARRQVFAPIHWQDTNASDARVGRLVNPAVDPISGEPEFKHTPVSVAPFLVDWYGFCVLRAADGFTADIAQFAWWTRIAGPALVRFEFAGRGMRSAPETARWARRCIGATAPDADLLEAGDPAEGMFRCALIEDDRLAGLLCVAARAEDLPGRAWLSGLFADAALAERDRAALLLGRPLEGEADPGATVCSCFGVGRNTIARAIVKQSIGSVTALGSALRCGTNCGSCVPELRGLLAELAQSAG